MNQVVIIGSGISGLTAALLLQRQGYDVLVVEQQAQAGGALHRFKREGIAFDVGFHYTGGLGDNQILRLLWRYCGIESSIPVIPFPEDAADCIRVDGFPETIHAYFSYERFHEELDRLFPSESEGIARFFRTIRETGSKNPFYNLTLPLNEFFRDLAFPEQKTLGNLIRSCTTDTALQAALSYPVFLHGVKPDKMGLAMHTSVAHPLYSGMYTVDGGGQAIADAYLDRMKDCGIEVLTNTTVESILEENGKVTGIVTSKGTYHAAEVIYTGHPALLPDLVPPRVLRKVYLDRLREMGSTPSMFMVFGTVSDDRCYPELKWNNYYSLPGGLEITGPDSSDPEEFFFLSGCGLRDLANNGKKRERAVIIMRFSSWEEATRYDLGRKKRTADYLTWKERESSRIIDAVNRKWDGLLRDFHPVNCASPLTFRDELRYVRGSVYGVQHSTDQFSVGARTRLPGLWLSGQSTLMTGIIGASLSALVTVGSMVGLESLWKQVKNCA